MNIYKGQFKDINEKDIYVEIAENKRLETIRFIPIKFPYEEPVVIESVSDGIFTPVKSTSCVIKIFTDDIHWDLYTPSATGYKVRVWNDEQTLFKGFLTPCVYSQDYTYKSEIELECVDYLAVLKQFEYKVNGDKDIVSVDELMNKIFSNTPDAPAVINKTDYDFSKLKLQEANFFDDDDNAMTCREVLDELFTYLGCSVVMYDGKIVITDTNKVKDKYPITLEKEQYGAGNPVIELDEVYNKITFGCNMYEVEDLVDDLFDEDGDYLVNLAKLATEGEQLYSDYYFSWRNWYHKTQDEHRYTMLVKPYTISEKSRWKNQKRDINTYVVSTDDIETQANKDIKTYKDSQGDWMFSPQYTGCYPIRVYSYNKKEGMANKTKINWDDYLMFPYTNYENWRLRTSYPALKFESDEKLAYSIKDGIGYIVFYGELMCQTNIGIDQGPDKDIVWCEAYKNGVKKTISMPLPMDNFGLQFDHQQWASKKPGTAYYNQGWNLMKAELKIGDKYWSSTSGWVNYQTTFWLSFHDDDVNGDDETLNLFTWLKPCSNPNVKKYEVGKDGFAIPIGEFDHLYGKLEFTLYTPEMGSTIINNYFLKDLSLEYTFKDSQHWADDKKVDDDIIYENVVDDSYATDMNEIDLKINSWYKDKPISKSYMLDENNVPVRTINGMLQEERLLEKYYNHFSTPKKIYSVNYKTTDTDPEQTYLHTGTESTKYLLDKYMMDVKMGETELKLIEL